MLSKLVIVGTVLALATATHSQHPINENLVGQIEAKNPNWKTVSPAANPLRNYSHDELLNMLGTFIVPVNGVYK